MNVNINTIEKITHIVSLGNRCEVAYQIRRYFLIEKSYPFDWWITPRMSLLKALKNLEVENMFNVEKLELTSDYTSMISSLFFVHYPDDSVINQDYGIHYYHDFLRETGNNDNGKINLNYKEQIPNVKKKFMHVFENFNNLNQPENSILFIRSGELEDENNELTLTISKYFDKCNFVILFINPLKSNIWTGSDSEWDKAFNAYNLLEKYKPT